MSDISDLIQQYKNLSGIFTGAGGDRIPPHGTTHAKNSTDPIPQEIDGIPVDLDGMGTGETIVLDGDGNLVPGAPLGSLVSLQTAYDNGGAIVMDDHDITINVADGYEFKVRDAGGNPLIDVSDISSVATILLAADVLTLKDSNTTTPIAIGEVGSPVFNTTAQSIMGAVNEVYAGTTPLAHASTHEAGGSDEIDACNITGTGAIGNAFDISGAITANPHAKIEQRDLTLMRTLLNSDNNRFVAISGKYLITATNTNELVSYDIITGAELYRVSISAYGTLCAVNGIVSMVDGSDVYYYSVPDLDELSSTSYTLTTNDCEFGKSSNKLYAINSAGNGLVRFSTDGTYDSASSMSGFLGNDICAFSLSADEETAYVLDAPESSAGNVYVRVVDISTFASPSLTGSLQLTTSVSGEINSATGMYGDFLAVFYTKGGAIQNHGTVLIDVSTPASPSIGYDSPVTFFAKKVAMCGGEAYFVGPSGANIPVYQLPGLTVQSSVNLDVSNVDSSAIGELRSADGERIIHTLSDFQRGTITAQAHDETRLMFDVIESVQSTDAKITNAVPGERYWILEASSSYPLNNYIFEMRSDGPHFIKPRVNDLMTTRTSNYLLQYNGTTWGSVEIPTRTELSGLLSDEHTHSNKTILDSLTATGPIMDTRINGTDVISVVASTDSEITGATSGQRYLISDGTGYNDHVFEKRGSTNLYIEPKNGDRIFEQERGIYHEYFDGQWVVTVDTVVRGTVTIPSGTSIGTWTSSHIQFNDGDPMMLNDDDLMMLECDYKLVSRMGTGRQFLHRSNCIDIAPEYQLHSYADDVDHGDILSSTVASSYVNIDGETTPDKSGIVYAEIVVEIASSPGSDLEIEYDIRLKGTLFLDAGTYDC